MRYLTCCINSTAEDIGAMVDAGREITYRTARRRIGKALCDAFPDYDWSTRPRSVSMRGDYHVRYFRSRFKGQSCYYVVWSAIEFVFV